MLFRPRRPRRRSLRIRIDQSPPPLLKANHTYNAHYHTNSLFLLLLLYIGTLLFVHTQKPVGI